MSCVCFFPAATPGKKDQSNWFWLGFAPLKLIKRPGKQQQGIRFSDPPDLGEWY